MRVLVVYCHPCPESFVGALRDAVCDGLTKDGHDVRLVDLYADNFDPVMSAEERRRYHESGANEALVADHLAHLRWAEGLVFVYPTWWYGQPAMLKGWFDRVWLPHAAFRMPEGRKPIGRVLTNIRRIAIVTTLGAPKWWWLVMGAPGRRMIMTGIGVLCHPRCKRLWLALHGMDSTTSGRREAFVARVAARLPAFMRLS